MHYEEGHGYKYEGEWKNGKRHGFGTYIQPYCETLIAQTLERGYQPKEYIGEWQDDKKHGHGVMYWSVGTIYQGYFAANDLVRGKITISDGSSFYRDGLTHSGYAPEWWDGNYADVPEWWYEDPDRTTYSELQRDVFSDAMDRTGETGDSGNVDELGFVNYDHLIDKYVVVNVDTLNLRSGAGTNYHVIDQLTKGAILYVMDSYDEWLNVITPDDKGGFVHGDYVVEQ